MKWTIIVSLFILRSLNLAEMVDVFKRAAVSSGVILLLVAAAVAFASAVSLSGAPATLTRLVLAISENPYLLLFCINILLFIVGMFLDAGPAILILGPILGPTMVELGIEPLHFAIVMCVNVTVGLATPPMGLVLFVAASLTDEKVERIALEMLPLLATHVVVIFLLTYVPAISLMIPWLIGFFTVPEGQFVETMFLVGQ